MTGLEFCTLYKLTGAYADIPFQGSLLGLREFLQQIHQDGVSAAKITRDYELSVWEDGNRKVYWHFECSGRGKKSHLKAVRNV
jgi:hypothetical protein